MFSKEDSLNHLKKSLAERFSADGLINLTPTTVHLEKGFPLLVDDLERHFKWSCRTDCPEEEGSFWASILLPEKLWTNQEPELLRFSRCGRMVALRDTSLPDVLLEALYNFLNKHGYVLLHPEVLPSKRWLSR